MAGSMESGGSEQQTLRLLQSLDRQRFAPELYVTYRRGSLLQQVPSDVPIHAYDDHPLRPWIQWPGRMHRHLVKSLRQLIEERSYDVVYDRSFHMTLIAAPACQPSQTPRLATIVSPPSLDLPSSEQRFLRQKFQRLQTGYRNAAAVVAVSETVRQDALEYYQLDPQQVTVIHSGIDIAKIQQAAKDLARLPDWVQRKLTDSANFNIACVGRMSSEKGHSFLIEAIAELVQRTSLQSQQVRLWMLGDGPLREELQRQVVAHGLTDFVEFTGRLDAVAPLLSRCQLLVSPSRYEGWSNAILEAMALRVPVVATRVGGTVEMIQHGQTGLLVDYNDQQALMKQIHWIQANPTAANDLATSAIDQLQRHWTHEVYVDQVQTMLQQVPRAGV